MQEFIYIYDIASCCIQCEYLQTVEYCTYGAVNCSRGKWPEGKLHNIKVNIKHDLFMRHLEIQYEFQETHINIESRKILNGLEKNVNGQPAVCAKLPKPETACHSFHKTRLHDKKPIKHTHVLVSDKQREVLKYTLHLKRQSKIKQNKVCWKQLEIFPAHIRML